MENQRGLRWAFTLNNPTDAEMDELTKLECDYIIIGREHMEEGLTPHLQGYVVFTHQKRFSTLKRFNPRIHWEKAIRGHRENIEYCSKEDTCPYERGKRPEDRRIRKISIRDELEKDLRFGDKVVKNKMDIIGFENEQNVFEEIIQGLLEKPEVVYVYGGTGKGKTYWAIRDACLRYGRENVSMLRFANSFAICNNYLADCLIIPEFRPSSIDAATFLEFTDGYGMVLNIKHGKVYIRPKAIYICSIKHPDEIYKEEINEQFKRRITRFIDKDLEPFIEL